MNYNPSSNKPRLSAAACFRRHYIGADKRYNYRPLNNLIGEMIDTTITSNQNGVGAIRRLRPEDDHADTGELFCSVTGPVPKHVLL